MQIYLQVEYIKISNHKHWYIIIIVLVINLPLNIAFSPFYAGDKSMKVSEHGYEKKASNTAGWQQWAQAGPVRGQFSGVRDTWEGLGRDFDPILLPFTQ